MYNVKQLLNFPQNLVDGVILLTIYVFNYNDVNLILILNKQNAPKNIDLASRVHTRRRSHIFRKHVDNMSGK